MKQNIYIEFMLMKLILLNLPLSNDLKIARENEWGELSFGIGKHIFNE